MSDQNLPAQNESNQMINAQPETESDRIAPTDTTTDNLFVTRKVGIGTGTNNPNDLRSLLNIGDGLGAGYRPWMERGTLVSGDTDNVFFGLKREEGGDRRDAVIAWGDNPIDVFRFIFTEVGGSADGKEIMRLQPNGNVGIGTTNPSANKTQLHVEGKLIYSGGSLGGISFGDRSISGFVENPTQGERWTWFADQKTAQLWSGGTKLTVQANGDLKAEGDIYAKGIKLQSSRELKENIAELSGKEAVEALKNLNPVKFNFKADSDKNLHIGFIAEDVPELVATSDRKTLSPMDIVAVLTQALKEQQNTISALAEKVKLLEDQTA